MASFPLIQVVFLNGHVRGLEPGFVALLWVGHRAKLDFLSESDDRTGRYDAESTGPTWLVGQHPAELIVAAARWNVTECGLKLVDLAHGSKPTPRNSGSGDDDCAGAGQIIQFDNGPRFGECRFAKVFAPDEKLSVIKVEVVVSVCGDFKVDSGRATGEDGRVEAGGGPPVGDGECSDDLGSPSG